MRAESIVDAEPLASQGPIEYLAVYGLRQEEGIYAVAAASMQ
jgi:hypothetical protein